MVSKYNPKEIEARWQKFWEEDKTFEVSEDNSKEKFYALIEFPYPSGAGLHVGHPRPFTAMDVISRKKRMEGYNVLYPIGFDAFGLPTENYAIKTGRPPAEVTQENIANFIRQLKMLGYSFDWSRAVDTTDPNYYKWTQWIFLQFFKHGLAYKKNIPINWCQSCKIGLANEEVVDGRCERCGGEVVKKDKEQWMLAITKYAESLLKGLGEVDYIERAKVQQKNWIGRSEGAKVKFKIKDSERELEIFTTRPDTLFGATYMVVAPEHKLIEEFKDKITNYDEVAEYVKNSKLKSDLERTELQKEKTGVELKGIKAVNPVNNEEIPIWTADYVLAGYGTGAIMAVPSHDERDFEFAKEYGLEIKVVLSGKINEQTAWEHANNSDEDNPIPDSAIDNFSIGRYKNSLEKDLQKQYEKGLSDGYFNKGNVLNIFDHLILKDSDFLNGLPTQEAKEKMIAWLEEKGVGKKEVNYKLRDWVFSRQRYWGEPIPLVHCEKCGWVPLDEKDLPLTLPEVEKYEPTDTGESPLSKIEEWVNTTCPKCGQPAKRETDVMPNWAGSSWYFLRYCDPRNNKEFASMEKLKYWMSVDWYNGGMEHTVLHLLYSRFWNQFLYDIGVVPTKEPYKKRTSHGMILAEDGEKMSKSRGNVVNPDEMVDRFGVDAFRTYIMFMGPFDQAVAWDTDGLKGVRRFLERVWNLQDYLKEGVINENLTHKTIKKVSEDIEEMKFNTAIAALMEFVNEVYRQKEISLSEFKILILLLSPFAPHLCEELWQATGNVGTLAKIDWPTYDESKIKEDKIILAVQINGKLRDTVEVNADIGEEEAKETVLKSEKVQKWLGGKELKKIIYVKGKLVNVVV